MAPRGLREKCGDTVHGALYDERDPSPVDQARNVKKPERSFKIIEVDEHHAKATAFNMLFQFWGKETQVESFRRGREALDRLAAAHREGVGACNIIDPAAVPPSEEARNEITLMIKHGGGGRLKHYSVLFEGTGFKAASVRAVVSAAHMLARAKANLAVFSSLAEAAAWHANQQRLIGRGESAADISSTIRQLRDTYTTQNQGKGSEAF